MLRLIPLPACRRQYPGRSDQRLVTAHSNFPTRDYFQVASLYLDACSAWQWHLRYHDPSCSTSMRSPFHLLLVGALLIAFPVPLAFAQQTTPDLILVNGRVFTSNANRPFVEALAIRGERIVAVGTSKEIVSLAGKETRRIELAGHTVIPGINDAHLHLTVGPMAYELPIKDMDPQWKEITAALSSAVTTVPKGTWITATFGPTVLDDPEATRFVLDKLAADNPVLLRDLT